MSKENLLDQFYTNPKIVEECINKLFDSFYSLKKKSSEYFFIEPSAGSGNFVDGLYKIGVDIKNKVFAIDIDPKNNSFVKKQDFFKVNFQKMKLNLRKTVTIGNPPFGKKGKLALDFLNESLKHSSIVAMILPMTFRRYSIQSKVDPTAKLVLDERLDPNSFIVGDREYNVNCCFQIWTRPEIITSVSDLRLKKQIRSLIDEIELFIHNNTKETLKFFNKKKYKWNFAVHRQGYYDYNKKITSENKLEKNHQYLFIKCHNKYLLNIIKTIDFSKLARKNSTTILGFSNSDFYEELYTKIIEDKIKNSLLF